MRVRSAAGAGGARWALAGVLAAAFNLRLAIAAVGPVIETVRGDLDLTSAEAGMLVMIPFLGMSSFALLGPPLLHRVGPARMVLGGMVLIAAGTAVRAVMPTGALLLVMTVPIGLGMGLASVSLPIVVKESFPGILGRVTGYYVAVMALGAAAVGYAIVPLSDLLGGWRAAFAATAIAAVGAFPFWLAARPCSPSTPGPPLGRPGLYELRLGLSFAAASMGFTGTITWVAAIYIDAGWTASSAGVIAAAIMLLSIPSALVLPGLTDGVSRGFWTAAAGAVMALGILGFALVPTVAPVIWLVVFAIGNGAFFPLVLTLPLDLGPSVEAVAPGVAWSMAIGFFMGSLAPVGVGALRDLSGGFAIPMSALAIASAAGGLAALVARRPPGPSPGG